MITSSIAVDFTKQSISPPFVRAFKRCEVLSEQLAELPLKVNIKGGLDNNTLTHTFWHVKGYDDYLLVLFPI